MWGKGMQGVLARTARTLRSLLPRRRLQAARAEQRHAIPLIEALSDFDLKRLNQLLPWQCFTLDSRGRRFGKPASSTKRAAAQVIPDRRIAALASRVDLADKEVLEVGCFEGIHTVALCQYGAKVTAIDARLENVVKTIVRASFYGFGPRVLVRDLDDERLDTSDLSCDVCVHVGVLYHLVDPARHLRELGSFVRETLLLDTHYTTQPDSVYDSGGRALPYMKYREGGRADPFSGMHDHAKWLRLDDITSLLAEAGFDRSEILETRAERNGPRAMILARRRAAGPTYSAA